jgi:hypothetical protein
MLDSKGNVLQENCLASLGWSNDQAAGSKSDRAEHIDEPACWWAATMLKGDARLRIERSEFAEILALAIVLGGHALNGHQLAGHHVHAVSASGLTFLDLNGNRRAGRDAIALHEVREDHWVILSLNESV